VVLVEVDVSLSSPSTVRGITEALTPVTTATCEVSLVVVVILPSDVGNAVTIDTLLLPLVQVATSAVGVTEHLT
jgi:hypothetical protein